MVKHEDTNTIGHTPNSIPTKLSLLAAHGWSQYHQILPSKSASEKHLGGELELLMLLLPQKQP